MDDAPLVLCLVWTVVEHFTLATSVVALSGELSNVSHPDLKTSWLSNLLGRRTDLHDGQWRSFREGLPVLALAMLGIHLPISHALQAWSSPRRRCEWCIAFGALFVAVLHGDGCIFVFCLILANYALVHVVPRSWLRAASWAFNIFFLILNDVTHGYVSLRRTAAFRAVRAWLPPERSPWHHNFNIAMLRLLSHNLDVHAASCAAAVESTADGPSDTSSASAHVDLRTYLAYTLYSPLYLAGPTMRFDEFHVAVALPRGSPQRPQPRQLVSYAAYLLALLAALELFSHYVHVGLLNFYLSRGAFRLRDGWEAFAFLYASLNFLWLKFSTIWSFSRLWALLDGLNPPENQLRWISTSTTVSDFWRHWHASFNEWLRAYLYIPLGGNRHGLLRTVAHSAICFWFVALWHDLNAKMLLWGGLLPIFLLPELVAQRYVMPRMPHGTRLTSVLRSAGIACNLNMLMVANMLGFGLGTASRTLDWWGSPTSGLPRFFAFCTAHAFVLIRRSGDSADRGRGSWLTLPVLLRVLFVAALACCTHHSLTWTRQPTMYMHCKPHVHWIPTPSAVTGQGLPRLMWGVTVLLFYAHLCIRRPMFSKASAWRLAPEMASLAVVVAVTAKRSGAVHNTATIVALTAAILDFRREGKPAWKPMAAVGLVGACLMLLHELLCVPFALDLFAVCDWTLVLGVCVLRTQRQAVAARAHAAVGANMKTE